MTIVADNYAKVLFDRGVSPEDLEEAKSLLAVPELTQALENPFVAKQEKRAVIDALFPVALRSFFKVMCDNGDLTAAEEMFEEYDTLLRRQTGTVRAVFTYVTAPDEKQIETLKQVICKQYHASAVALRLEEDASLLGGFLLTVEDFVLDKSLRTAIGKMSRHFAVR